MSQRQITYEMWLIGHEVRVYQSLHLNEWFQNEKPTKYSKREPPMRIKACPKPNWITDTIMKLEKINK